MNKGGRIISKGYKGAVMDIYNDNNEDEVTVYNELKNDTSNSIFLVSLHKEIKLNQDKKNWLLGKLKNTKEKLLAKKFMNASFLFGTNSKNFSNELDGYRNIIRIFGKDIEKYTTVKSIFNYKNDDIYGLIFNGNYYIFLERCYSTLENIKFTQTLLDKCYKDIIETLNILNKYNYIHNDIKPDNIIFCNNRFKLIDWETSNDIKNQSWSFINTKNGSLVFNHPIKFYNIGVPLYIYRYLYEYEVLTYKFIKNKKITQKYHTLTIKNFNNTLREFVKYKNIDDNDINTVVDNSVSHVEKGVDITKIKKNKYYFLKLNDYYSFALTLIIIANNNKLKPPTSFINNVMKAYKMI